MPQLARNFHGIFNFNSSAQNMPNKVVKCTFTAPSYVMPIMEITIHTVDLRIKTHERFLNVVRPTLSQVLVGCIKCNEMK